MITTVLAPLVSLANAHKYGIDTKCLTWGRSYHAKPNENYKLTNRGQAPSGDTNSTIIPKNDNKKNVPDDTEDYHLRKGSSSSEAAGTSNRVSNVRGMADCFGKQALIRKHILNTFEEIASLWGYHEVHTPIVEKAELYTRSLGSDGEIVAKEMYTFTDRSNEILALRPEGTASIVRAHMGKSNWPLKCYYYGPMFRYERPQTGRQRQFHQLGVEHLQSEGSFADAECISLANTLLKSLKIPVSLRINSLGDPETRVRYRTVLQEYFQSYSKQLSEISRSRLIDGRVLRILDSKEPEDQPFIDKAPKLSDFLKDQNLNYWTSLLQHLDQSQVSYTKDPYLVRGLDYYNQAVFEFVDPSNAKFAYLAGGRYDHLAEQIGGNPVAGIGWAAGIERLESVFNEANMKSPPVSVVIGLMNSDPISKALQYSNKLSQALRDRGVNVTVISGSKSMSSLANRLKLYGCQYSMILGDRDLSEGQTTLMNSVDGSMKKVFLTELLEKGIEEWK